MKLARYLTTFAGQHDVPWAVMSLLAVKSGAVSKDYMLASAIYGGFLTVDIVARVMPQCEEVGIDKKKVMPYVPILAFVGIASFLRWKQM